MSQTDPFACPELGIVMAQGHRWQRDDGMLSWKKHVEREDCVLEAESECHQQSQHREMERLRL